MLEVLRIETKQDDLAINVTELYFQHKYNFVRKYIRKHNLHSWNDHAQNTYVHI